MKLYSDKLPAQLARPLLPLYWVAGDEALLMQEACDQIRQCCRKQGYSERELYQVDGNFDWRTLAGSVDNLSLFAQKKIIELRMRSSKLDESGRQALQKYANSPDADTLLLIISPKVDARSLNTKWFKVVESAGAFIQVWPVDRTRLPQWISQRLRQHNIRADQEAIAMLADKVEGNLLAANQEIEKLSILTDAGPDRPVQLGGRDIMQAVADNSRYNSFSLIDTALQGDSRRTLKIINGLRTEGAEPLMLLGLFCRELRNLGMMLAAVEQGQTIGGAMQAKGVWKNRQGFIGSALNRLNSKVIYSLLQQARLVDQSVKGLARANAWDELTDLALALSGQRTLKRPS